MPETVAERTERPAVNLCPCCGANVKEPFVVDLGGNKLAVEGKTIDLMPKVAEVLFIMLKAYPGTIDREMMMSKLYGMQSDQPGIAILNVYVTYARAALVGTDWTIRGVQGRGYRLERRT